MGTAVDEDETYEERWQVYRHDGKWWWHLCVPYAEPHGPYDNKQQAVDDLRTYTLAYLYEEAAENEPDGPDEGAPLFRFTAYEHQGLGISNPGAMASIPISEEMWATVCEKAAAADMAPHEYMLARVGVADPAEPNTPIEEE